MIPERQQRRFSSPMTFPEQVRWFERLSRDDLREYLHIALSTGRISPIILAPDVRIEHVLAQVFRASLSAEFQARLRTTLVELFGNWSLQTEPPSYIGSLLLVIARTGAAHCREHLVRLANIEKLKGIIGDGEDLHLRLLRVLVGIGVDTPDESLLSRDLGDPRYAPICYRGLFEADLSNGIRYCAQLVKVASAHPQAFPLDYQLEQMSAFVGRDKLLRSLGKIFRELSPDEWMTLFEALQKVAKIGIQPAHDEYLHFVDDIAPSGSSAPELYKAFRNDGSDVDVLRIVRAFTLERVRNLQSEIDSIDKTDWVSLRCR